MKKAMPTKGKGSMPPKDMPMKGKMLSKNMAPGMMPKGHAKMAPEEHEKMMGKKGKC